MSPWPVPDRGVLCDGAIGFEVELVMLMLSRLCSKFRSFDSLSAFHPVSAVSPNPVNGAVVPARVLKQVLTPDSLFLTNLISHQRSVAL